MNIDREWIVLDTNEWIFGLRNHSALPSCHLLLQRLFRLQVKIPQQILLELRANLSDEEMSDLFRLWRQYPDQVEIHWEKADSDLIQKYQHLGCKLGDAAVAAHLEAMRVGILVSENRHFLEEITGLPFQVWRADDVLRASGESEDDGPRRALNR